MARFLNHFITYTSAVATITTIILLAVELVFYTSFENRMLFYQFHFGLLIYFSIDSVIRFLMRANFGFSKVSIFTNSLVFIPLVSMVFLDLGMADLYGLVQFIFALIIFVRFPDFVRLVNLFRVQPTQLFLLGFIVFIFIGALLLSLPLSRTVLTPLSFIDAVFTATSALCVTGLVLHDVGEYFSGFGYGVILVLIQFGGLGIMAFYALMMLVIRSKVSRNQSIEYQEALATEGVGETFALIKSIFLYTFWVECIGAFTLFMLWKDQFSTVLEAIMYSVFHSISAFCNAGFSLFPDSLMSFLYRADILLVFSVLIIVGGIGFPVIFNIRQHYFSVKKERLKVQTKLPLFITFVLIALGTLILFFVEQHRVLSGFPVFNQWVLAFFHSVSSRSAGFNVLDIASFSTASLLVIILLMFIGSSPGSTGGGIKTTTFGIIHAALFSVLRGETKVELFGRTISSLNVYRALNVFFISAIIIFTALFSLLLTEVFEFVPLLFESVSAFGTTGLSMGVTAGLSSAGKLSMIALMLIGRLGPLTIGMILAKRRVKSNYSFPEERILLG